MIPTLRTLTKKSKLGFGKSKNLTVLRMLELGKKIDLISAYYKLSSINYTKEVLDELNIKGDFVIVKPGTNKDVYYLFLEQNGFKKKIRNREGSNKLKRETKPMSKRQLQRINQGK